MVVMIQESKITGKYVNKIQNVLNYAEDFIIHACVEHGFEDLDITIKLGRGVKQAGSCSYRHDDPYAYTIALSRPFIEQCDFDFMDDVIRHELAHAFAPRGAHHDDRWKLWAETLGAKPERCHSATLDNIYNWKAVCPSCGQDHKYVRKPRVTRSCGICNPKKFDERYVLEVTKIA